MISCWHVSRTYWRRLRFWIFGAAYLIVVLELAERMSYKIVHSDVDVLLFIALVFGCVVSSLAALHLRRLLSGPAVQAVPRYTAPHLFVGGLVGLLIWGVTPLAVAWWSGSSPLHLLGLFALVGILYSLALVWPSAIVSIVLAPLLVIWAMDSGRPGAEFLRQLFEGQLPVAAGILTVVAIVSYPLAGWLRWRWRDRSATFSDDLVADRSEQVAGPVRASFLQQRDAAIERRIWQKGGLGWTLVRWTIPCAVSWTEWGLLVVVVLAVGGATALAMREPSAMIAIASVAGLVTLFVPLGYWRFRANSLAAEFVRPVTRQQFVRQFLGAMLWNFAGWTVLAMLISVSGYLPLLYFDREPVLPVFLMHAAIIWAMAAWLYGIAVATIQMRWWLPWFLGLLLASMLAVGVLSAIISLRLMAILQTRQIEPGMVFVATALTQPAIGVFLIGLTYYRWRGMEIR